MALTSTPAVADQLFGVGWRRRGEAGQVDLFTPTCEQAWEAARLELLEALLAAADDRAAAALEDALHELDGAGPQGSGWRRCLDDVELWYGPTAIERPVAVSRGEAALLLALGVRRRP